MNDLALAFDGPIARITIDRAGRKNALDLGLIRSLLDAFSAAEREPAARAILLDANGPVFCSGLEPGEALNSSTGDEAELIGRLLGFGSRATKPVVAAVQGAALAAGAALVANAHVALAAQGTLFGFTEIRAGLWPFASWNAIAGALGSRRALELTLTGRVFNAHDALAWGLIHEITQPTELEDRAFATASLLATAPPLLVRDALDWSRSPGRST